MAAPSPSASTRQAASRGLLFLCSIPLWLQLQVAFPLCRRLSLHDQVPRFKESIQTQCSRPCGTSTCYLHTAIWLGRCQPILTRIQHSDEANMFCHRVFPFSSTTCLHVGPKWPPEGCPPGRLDQPEHSLLKMQILIAPTSPILVLHTYDGDETLFSCVKCSRTTRPGTRAFTFQLEATGSPGLLEKQQRRQQQSYVDTSESKVHAQVHPYVPSKGNTRCQSGSGQEM